MKKTIMTLLGAVALSGCAGTGGGNPSDLLINRHFILSAVDGKPVHAREGIRPGISFAPGLYVSGVMCNRFFGQGTLEQGRLQVPQLASTRMLCKDADLNQWEQTLSSVLNAGAAVSLQQEKLTLSGAGHVLEYQSEK